MDKDFYKNKKAVGVNTSFLSNHLDEIVDSATKVAKKGILLAPYPILHSLKRYSPEEKKINKAFLETGNWYHFGPSQAFIKSGETESEAINRINHEYCEYTGFWDLFEWKEVKK